MDKTVADFEMFWREYPRKQDKNRAYAAFRGAMRGRKETATRMPYPPATLADILLGLAYYPFSDDPQYIPLPATWLNNRRWIPEQISTPLKIYTPAGRSSWRDKHEHPVLSDVNIAEAADWKPPVSRRLVAVHGEVFADD